MKAVAPLGPDSSAISVEMFEGKGCVNKCLLVIIDFIASLLSCVNRAV